MIIQGDPKDAYQKAENYSEVFKDVLFEKNFIRRKKTSISINFCESKILFWNKRLNFIRKKNLKLYVLQNMYD